MRIVRGLVSFVVVLTLPFTASAAEEYCDSEVARKVAINFVTAANSRALREARVQTKGILGTFGQEVSASSRFGKVTMKMNAKTVAVYINSRKTYANSARMDEWKMMRIGVIKDGSPPSGLLGGAENSLGVDVHFCRYSAEKIGSAKDLIVSKSYSTQIKGKAKSRKSVDYSFKKPAYDWHLVFLVPQSRVRTGAFYVTVQKGVKMTPARFLDWKLKKAAKESR
jgi:hypothetical protein